jgi:hypothetical protein
MLNQMQQRYKKLIEQLNRADEYFRERYNVDNPENKARALVKIAEIIQELQELEQKLYPWMQQYTAHMADNRQSLYVEFPPPTFDNFVERIDIIQADGWRLVDMVQRDGKEYGYFERG